MESVEAGSDGWWRVLRLAPIGGGRALCPGDVPLSQVLRLTLMVGGRALCPDDSPLSSEVFHPSFSCLE